MGEGTVGEGNRGRGEPREGGTEGGGTEGEGNRGRGEPRELINHANPWPQPSLPPSRPESCPRLRARPLFRRVRASLMQQQPLLDRQSPAETRKSAVRAHNAMSRNDDSKRVRAYSLPHRARRLRSADGMRHVAICANCARRNLRQRLPHRLLKLSPSVHVQWAG